MQMYTKNPPPTKRELARWGANWMQPERPAQCPVKVAQTPQNSAAQTLRLQRTPTQS